ncbi:AAA family ATPase [Microbacterium sp. LWS13-1.2]|uniref:AAA family ATPase n=1 Tax=Microbacterium sp. LWS13-1.2 TaxID=3135264 RepID=A0AAU6S8T8_9MICO
MQTPTLVGREHDIVALDTFLGIALSAGGALLLPGEAGVGKTELLRHCAEVASVRGASVLRASGVQFEAELSFGTLHQLLRPIISGLDRLPPPLSSALRSALGMSDPNAAVEPLMVYNAALALLADAAGRTPLLVAVDDLHWMDAASAAALAFITRRLDDQRVGFVGAVRDGEASHFDSSGIRVHRVRPLSSVEADRLVRERAPALPATVRQELVRRSAGYPLALVEWISDVEHVMRSDSDALPLPGGLEASFAARIERLPVRTHKALLLLALDGRTGVHELGRLGLQFDDLEPAESAGTVMVDEDANRVEFRHPLFRSALVSRATSAERRQMHLQLAESNTDDPDRRVWHLAAAAIAPDESVARLLQELAHRSFSRGDPQGATSALTRAALLSPSAPDRARRLAEAAFLGADVAGDLHRAQTLLADARADLGRGPGSLYAVVAQAQVTVNAEGAHRIALERIERAVREGTHGWQADDHELIATFRTWLLLCSYAGDPQCWEAYFDALDRLVPEAPEVLRAESWAVGDTVRKGEDARPTVIRLASTPPPDEDPTLAMSMTFAAMYLDLIDLWRPYAWDRVVSGREGGPPRPYARCLSFLSINEYLHGRWIDAQHLADEGAQLCEEHGFGNGAWYFAYLQALLAAGRGDTDAARERSAFVDAECSRRESWGAQRFSYQPRVLAAVADGNWEEVYRTASRLGAPGELPRFVPPAMWVGFDLVEAAVRLGLPADAYLHSRAMVDSGLPGVSPRMALLTAGAVALSDGGADWRERFEEALRMPEASSWPFDLARVQLAYGERLRRAVDTSRAREVLHDALEIFERLGAIPWVERSSQELRATGDASVRIAAEHGLMSDLTSQELVIAEMAASGMTNKDIAHSLFLSPRTVSGHLYNTFPKLGITSRAGLRDALARLEG